MDTNDTNMHVDPAMNEEEMKKQQQEAEGETAQETQESTEETM